MCLQVIGAVVSAVGTLMSGFAQAAAARYQAQVAAMNAQIAEQRAQDAIDRAADEEQKQRMRTAQLVGTQMAALGANGVSILSGSPLDTLEDTVALGELDALEIRRNGELEAHDFRVQKFNFQAEAGLKRLEARTAIATGFIGATKGLIDDARQIGLSAIGQIG